ncbi:hypothetical protein [Paenibacillus sp. FSL H8-0034]|uniref:hypothetical protein n=1 Tax=Paenibacillus sp. FSL H8-0034 TaxID=2954671 RepID=UPI0030FA4067
MNAIWLTTPREQFKLELAEEKTRLMTFGRFARERKVELGERLDTFDFLGFKDVCGIGKKGKFAFIRIPNVKSCRKFTERVGTWLKAHRHWKRYRNRVYYTAQQWLCSKAEKHIREVVKVPSQR